MYPRIDMAPGFKYPNDRLLPVWGVSSEALLRQPDMLDIDGEACLLVIKNGSATGTTIGRATGIFSYIRRYFSDSTHQTSSEWSILPYNKVSGAFSAPGNSGSAIVDGFGRIGGILTGGAGETASSDNTHATQYTLFLAPPTHPEERVSKCPPLPGHELGATASTRGMPWMLVRWLENFGKYSIIAYYLELLHLQIVALILCNDTM